MIPPKDTNRTAVAPRWEVVLSAVLTLAAVAMAAALVRLAFFPPGPQQTAAVDGSDRPTYIDDWLELVDDGIHLGDREAPIQVLMFSDLECPFCARFHEDVLRQIWDETTEGVGFSFIHFPLERHRFARPAAHAAECANEQGRFMPFIDGVYGGQDSLGLKSWWAFAHGAGVADSTQFEQCLRRDPPDRIQRGREWAEALQIRGTPSIVVSGWRLPAVPDVQELREIMEAVRAGRPPVPSSGP